MWRLFLLLRWPPTPGENRMSGDTINWHRSLKGISISASEERGKRNCESFFLDVLWEKNPKKRGNNNEINEIKKRTKKTIRKGCCRLV